MLILPGDPLFDWTLASNLPPNWRQVSESIGEACAFVADAGSGVLRPCNSHQTEDYLYGGEYGDRLSEIDDDNDWDEPDLTYVVDSDRYAGDFRSPTASFY